MEKGERPESAFKKNNGGKNIASVDPVRDFEKWKKKHDKIRIKVKQSKQQKRKPQWQVERESIQRLVSKYNQINAKDAVKFSDFPISKNTLRGETPNGLITHLLSVFKVEL